MGQESRKNSPEESEDIVFEEEETSGAGTIKKLRDRLGKCVSEKQEYLEGWQRAKADFINYKKEEEKRLQSSTSFFREKIIKDFLQILDSFYLAKESSSWNDGMEGILGQFEKILKDYEVKKITELSLFDPVLHESVEMIPVQDKKEDGKIEKVLQDGYKMREKVIRPAKVQVKIYQNN